MDRRTLWFYLILPASDNLAKPPNFHYLAYIHFSKLMAENKFKKIFTSRVFLFLLLLAFIWLALVLVKAFYKKRQMNQEIGALKSEIAKMDKKGQELNQLLSYFSSQSYLEKEAKDKLNLKKEGESVVMVQGSSIIDEAITAENNQQQENAAKASEPAKENNFIKWWKFFFKR